MLIIKKINPPQALKGHFHENGNAITGIALDFSPKFKSAKTFLIF
jgi:hypothetical protein